MRTNPRQADGRMRRRGAVAALTAISLVALLGMAALAVDAGMLYVARTELQSAADAAALAAAWEMLDEERLHGDSAVLTIIDDARQTASEYAVLHKVLNAAVTVDPNEDVSMGYLGELTYQSGVIATADPSEMNAVTVTVRRNETRNGPVALLFSQIFGNESANVAAEATAAFSDAIEGFRVTEQTGNAGLLPFALYEGTWNDLLNGTAAIGDNYTYDRATGAVSAGPDGIPEMNLYPGSGNTQLPPGNFGTVDIGAGNNSTSDLSRQIVSGVNESDLSYYGGELRVPVFLNGDTGISAGIKDELASIIGQARTIPLFDSLSGGSGNNATYRVNRFAGIRIMDVRLTGSASSKCVIIQPAIVVDDAALAGDGSTISDYVYTTVRLVR